MEKLSLSNAELLKFAVESGMVDLALVQEQVEMQMKKEYLERHPYAIWEDKNGVWHTYLPDQDKGRVHRKRKSEKEIHNVVVEYWREQEDNPTLEEVFNEYNDRRLELQKISAATHMREKQYFARFFDGWKDRRVKYIKEEEIEDFLEKVVPEHNITAKTFNNLKGIMKRMFKRAKKRKLISFSIESILGELDPSEIEFRKNIKEDYEEVFNEDDYPVMMEYLESNIDIWNLGIIIMFVTGIRVGELVALSFDDFTVHQDFISFKIRRTETRYKDNDGEWVYELKEAPKTDAGIREAIIPKQYTWIYDKLKKINPAGQYVFERNGQRMNTNMIRKRMRRVCDRLHIYPKSPHKARKTYGSILLDNKLDERLIIGQMGHTDISCTKRFYHRNRRNIEKKAIILSSVGEFDSQGIKRYQTGMEQMPINKGKTAIG